MYDGTTFMDVEGGLKECIDGMNSIKKCPVEDLCCFALREHIAFEFWGRKYHLFYRLELVLKYNFWQFSGLSAVCTPLQPAPHYQFSGILFILFLVSFLAKKCATQLFL